MLEAIVDLGAGARRWRTSVKLAVQDIELRYKRSMLGPFWISASLVATILALAYVFSAVFRQEFANYIAFLGAGLLTWQLILTMVNEGAASVTEHSSFLQNVRMPLSTAAGRIVMRNAIIFAHNAGAVMATLLIFGLQPTSTMLLAIPGAALILFTGFFVALALGPLCTRFRDIPLVIQSIMQVIFFLTPIFWLPDSVTHRPMFIHANPFYHMIELVRAPLLGEPATMLNWQVALWCCAGAMLVALISVSIARRRVNLWL